MKKNTSIGFKRNESLTSLFFGVSRKMRRELGGRHSQQKVLRLICENENVTQKDLQTFLQIEAGSLSELLSKLVDKGFIVREKSEADRRRTILQPTEAGREKVAEFNAVKDEILFSRLNREERNTLRILLEKLYEEGE